MFRACMVVRVCYLLAICGKTADARRAWGLLYYLINSEEKVVLKGAAQEYRLHLVWHDTANFHWSVT